MANWVEVPDGGYVNVDVMAKVAVRRKGLAFNKGFYVWGLPSGSDGGGIALTQDFDTEGEAISAMESILDL